MHTTATLDPSITQGFADALTVIGLLAVALVGVVMAGLGIRVGVKWLRQAFNKA